MRQILYMILGFSLIASAAYAQSPSTSPSSIEKLERKEMVDKAIKASEEMDKAYDGMLAVTEQQCLKAVGNQTFCKCISKQMPFAVDFRTYVSVITKTKSELNYSQLSEQDKKLVDNVRIAREKCVVDQ